MGSNHARAVTRARASSAFRALRRTAALAAVVTVAVLGLAVPAAQAQAGGPYNLCQVYLQVSPGTYCATLHSGSPGHVFMNSGPYRAAAEVFEVAETGSCDDGQVTSTCPFANPALDQALIGHDIVQVEFFEYGLCLAAQSNNELYGATCASGSNESFVLTNNGRGFVTVGGSNVDYEDGMTAVSDAGVLCSGVDFENDNLLWLPQANCSGAPYFDSVWAIFSAQE
jgi:hypothetical protein